MAYTKVDKDTSSYSKVNKTKNPGWFQMGWFKDWLAGLLYHKVEKTDSTYTKINKE